MYLKKVEVCGFKSFADKTVLNFEQGISGIIGPNGCGKSNISDSIRWCLGEQRAKSMRSSNMQEVIFGGTQTRATTGMAEVSLTFDNSQNILPIDYSEVTVTRRLFRSGESEYFINKTQCRLKDIRDMFLDTGIGSDGYSIIEQGKVDFLTTAKPEDRRELFEEAAGVSKYKVRREETLRRLEKIDADMSRLSDALAIHKQQITALDIAAKKAKQYKKYQEELANYEVASLVHHISYGNNEIVRIKTELDPKIKEFESTNTLMAQLDTEIQEIRLSLDEKNESYVSVNKDLSEIKMQIGVADQIIQHAMQREGEIKSEKESLEQELVVNREKVIQMEEQLKTLNSDDGTLADDLVKYEADYREKERQYNLVKSRLSELEARENEIREKLSQFESEKEQQHNLKAELSESRIHLDAELDSLRRIISRLENDVEPTRQEIVNIEAELESANTSIGSFETKKEEINKIISENEEKRKSLENILLKHKESLASNDSRVSTLKEFDQQDPVRSSIRAVLSLGNLARGPVSSIIDADEDKQELVASALGERLNYLVCDTAEKADQAIKFLEENGLSRLSFIVADKISDSVQNSAIGLPQGYTELIKFLKYNSSDEKIIRYVCSGALVSGNKIYGNVVVSGGGKISFEKPVLIEEQIKNLQNKSEELKLNISTAQSEIERIYENQINLRLEKERLGFDAIKVKTQIEGKRSQIEEKKNDIKSITEEINKHKEEISSKATELNSFNEKISVFEIKLAEHEDEENRLYEELKIIENDTFAAKKEEETLAPLMMEARSVWDKKVAEFENKRQGQQYLLDNIANIKKQIEYAENKIVESDEKLSELLTSQETETVKIQQLYESQAQKEVEIQSSLTDRQSLQDVLDSKTNEWHALRGKVDELNNEVNAMQIDLKNFEYQKNDLEKRLAETYSKTYEEIKNDFDGIEVNNEEITKIKRKMESLGSVNLAAQEEYDALEQRYNFLLAQQQDLLKAKDDLLEVIKKINQSTIENFKKTFDIVRDNFKNLYRKLFGGGEADLMLTDENNLLESGVDIYAQPPGKKLQNISLCSGGEKALTAVALLFAFFMVKPSPFCILDEVDAPLDDANVGRYNSMIKEFASKTQFLVVTHNKRTMEMADVLYGVTMEEHGISKIISVKMNKQDEVDSKIQEA
ncbi:chromosome segregation protein SMC [Candidatus Endomicrobiellum devescovinae]|jgi:chromosome segregation protein|uniref:chromosome segregation protein SMC n=1 Tax=Candidatus Endomicrobiellum devescovinae TaxID=3242322 RepID=UPI002827702B|nr:chromosome segregation protein SMC [Endomicrobium sp.]